MEYGIQNNRDSNKELGVGRDNRNGFYKDELAQIRKEPRDWEAGASRGKRHGLEEEGRI